MEYKGDDDTEWVAYPYIKPTEQGISANIRLLRIIKKLVGELMFAEYY